MTSNKPSMPQTRNLRQTIEGMPLIFNASAAGDLKAIIQFNVIGKEPGAYHLSIGDGDCTFHIGASANPTLTINTPSEAWLQISSGQISGQDALFKGLYKIEGDGSILLKMGDLFKSPENFTVYDISEPANEPAFSSLRRNPATGDRTITAGKHPAGPIALGGMGWMTLFFVPWTIFWILFDIRSVNPWFSTGIPFILMSLIIFYRLVFNKPTWMETASWAFFLVACVLAPIARVPVFLNWGSIIGSLFVGLMWQISLSPWFKLPFSAEYSKWGFVRKLWANSMFIQPNMAISLVWGWQFIIACIFGVIARVFPALFIPFTILRYGLMIPASIFTTRYQKGVMDRKFTDIDRTMSNLRIWAYTGALVIVLFLVLVAFALFTPA